MYVCMFFLQPFGIICTDVYSMFNMTFHYRSIRSVISSVQRLFHFDLNVVDDADSDVFRTATEVLLVT